MMVAWGMRSPLKNLFEKPAGKRLAGFLHSGARNGETHRSKAQGNAEV